MEVCLSSSEDQQQFGGWQQEFRHRFLARSPAKLKQELRKQRAFDCDAILHLEATAQLCHSRTTNCGAARRPELLSLVIHFRGIVASRRQRRP